jgi:excisionase family DNA binding protein
MLHLSAKLPAISMNSNRNFFEHGNELSDADRLLKKPEMAAYCGVTTRTLETWVKDGRIPCFKIGRTVRFRLADVLEFLHK